MLMCPRFCFRSKMPCGITTPSAQDGKSWSNAWKGRLLRMRPLRYSFPRCSLALVSMENQGFPADSYCSINSASLSNCALRSGCSPPGRSLRICRRRIPPSCSQVAIASRPTGVPMSARRSASLRGDRSVNTMSSSSGSPPVRTSRQEVRFFSSLESDSIFFFARHPADAPGRRPGHPVTGPVL
jgi:hypothetical protein